LTRARGIPRFDPRRSLSELLGTSRRNCAARFSVSGATSSFTNSSPAEFFVDALAKVFEFVHECQIPSKNRRTEKKLATWVL